jgi:uncharacterized protein (TIGR03118 family)
MLAVVLTASYLGMAGAANAAGYTETDLVIGGPPGDPNIDFATNPPTLTDAVNNIKHQAPFDPNLQNPWGIAASGTSPFWISDNGAGVSTLYNSQGQKRPLVVSIPSPDDPLGASGTPTGAVFNPSSSDFMISGVDKNGNPITRAAVFLFATEDGTIVGWNPNVNPSTFDPVADAANAGTYGIIAVDNSARGNGKKGKGKGEGQGAVYKGLAIAQAADGSYFLYAANFRQGRVEMYHGSTFALIDTFTDKKAKGYAPFNVVSIGSQLVVTFAVPNKERHDDVAGPGNGIVETFDLSGNMLKVLVQGGSLNSPWGVAPAPSDFGDLKNDLLIGNFGDGKINAFDPDSGALLGTLTKSDGKTFVVDGLWAIKFGTDSPNEGTHNTLFFTAGVNGETDGLFGKLTPN